MLFRSEGVLFKDITTLLKEPQAFKYVVTQIALGYIQERVELVVGIESRGFIFGTALANQLGKGFIPIRKPGKLPGTVIGVDYSLEYGSDRLEIIPDGFENRPRVLIVDDLVATGGTLLAATKLFRSLGGVVVGTAFFAGMIGCIRILADDLPPFEIVLFRNLFSFICMLPWLLMSGIAVLRTSHQKLYLFRSTVGFTSMCLWFTGVAYLPLNESTALSFTAPLFASVGAVVFLGGVIRLRRWTATIIGFLGTMIILRPGFADLTWAQGIILASTVTSGINTVMVKQLTRTESPNAIVTYMTLYALPFSIIAAAFVWVTPPLHTWPYILMLGFFATIGHLCLTRAFVCMDATSVEIGRAHV